MPIKKVYYIELTIPCKYEPLGFHESEPDIARHMCYVTEFKQFIFEQIEYIIAKPNQIVYTYH